MVGLGPQAEVCHTLLDTLALRGTLLCLHLDQGML